MGAVVTAQVVGSRQNGFGHRKQMQIAASIATIIFAFPMLPYLAEPADLWNHIEYAKRIHSLADIVSPHFLFQLILVAANGVTGLTHEAAAIILMSLCYGAMAAMVARNLQRAAPEAGAAVVVVSILVLIASHIFLQTAFSFNFLYGYIAPTVYHNPTQVLGKVLAVAIIGAYSAFAFDRRDDAYLRGLTPIAIILSAIAKPSFLIAFLPCVFAVELYRWTSGDWRSALSNMALIGLPAVIVLAIQYLMTFNSSGTGEGIAFAPFLVYGGATEVLVKLPAALLFPVVTLAIAIIQRAITRRLIFAWFLYFVGMLISVCLVESGPRMMQGNFAWTGQTVTFLLYVESVVLLFSLASRKAWLGWIAFSVHVVFGIIWYLAALLMPLGTFL